MNQLSCNACQILPWISWSKKVNYIKFIQRFVPKIEVKTTKGHCTGVKFSSSSNFNEKGLKLIRLSCRFRKCIVSYTVAVKCPHFRQSSTTTDHKWALTSDTSIHILPDFLDMQNYTFSESSW